MKATADNWYAANQRVLAAAVALARARVAAHLGREPEAQLADLEARLRRAEEEMPSPSALQVLAATFGLSDFERELLMLCAAVELDSATATLVRSGDGREGVDFSVALATLPQPHWNAITPLGPLRRHRFIEMQPGPQLVRCGLRIEERALHFLAGIDAADERLMGIIEPLYPPAVLLPEHEQAARRVATLWSDGRPSIMLCGRDPGARNIVAAAACAMVDAHLFVARVADLPHAPAARENVYRLWERDAALSGGALMLDVDDDDPPAEVKRLVDQLPQLALVSCHDGLRSHGRALVRIDIPPSPPTSQRALWQAAMGADWPALEPHIEAVLTQFTLSAGGIAAAAAALRAQPGDASMAVRAWDACRVQARAHLDLLAQRLEPVAGWDDLVLPKAEMETLREIVAHVKQRQTVYQAWGFGRKSERGLGTSTLFAGQSGTGKTMAAEVLARELRLDLYRIDLSQVVSKYIKASSRRSCGPLLSWSLQFSSDAAVKLFLPHPTGIALPKWFTQRRTRDLHFCSERPGDTLGNNTPETQLPG